MGRVRSDASNSVTPERAIRLAQLIRLISKSPQPRQKLMNKLGVDLRGFYRDVKTLRELEIEILNSRDQYLLNEELEDARGKLPSPDPQLTLAELKQISKGHSEAHRKLKRLLESIVGPPPSNGHIRHR